MNILLIGPTYMDLYKDIINELGRLGHVVDFIKERHSKNDPLNIRREYTITKRHSDRQKKEYWKKYLLSPQYNKIYDLLIVIDGQGLHPYLFDILKVRNSGIVCVNYLFDTIKGVYRFDKFFGYFDKVFTFDLSESKKFNILFLPIYWCPDDAHHEEKYDLFGFGAYTPSRFAVYEHFYNGLKDRPVYIKLFAIVKCKEWFHELKRKIRGVLGLIQYIPIKDYHSPIICHETIKPKEFRELIYCSRVVLDTNPPHQDGLTARFMWALGAKKKIITTNSSVLNYDFFTNEQILIVDKDGLFKLNEVLKFIDANLYLSQSTINEIDKYRIDNWLKTICPSL